VLAGLCAGVLPDLVMKDALRRRQVTVLKSPLLYREIFWLKRRGRALPQAVDFLVTRLREEISQNAGRAS
jgi:DNA-binding transcriptional LysR family regulator